MLTFFVQKQNVAIFIENFKLSNMLTVRIELERQAVVLGSIYFAKQEARSRVDAKTI